jgi:hypothetical protein
MSKLAEIVCSYFKGKGKVNEDGDIPPNFRICPVCGGHKSIRVPTNYRRCGDCEGGRKYDSLDPLRSFSQCRRWGGSGWVKASCH